MDPYGLYGKVTATEARRWQHVPLFPAMVVFEDRGDQSLYVLSHSEDRANILLTTEFTTPRYGTVYFAKTHGGPYLTDKHGAWIRLFVRDGNLGWEDSEAVSSPRVFTRRGQDRTMLELYLPDEWQTNYEIAYREWIQ